MAKAKFCFSFLNVFKMLYVFFYAYEFKKISYWYIVRLFKYFIYIFLCLRVKKDISYSHNYTNLRLFSVFVIVVLTIYSSGWKFSKLFTSNSNHEQQEVPFQGCLFVLSLWPDHILFFSADSYEAGLLIYLIRIIA